MFVSLSGKPVRENWRFNYLASDVAKGAQAQKEFRQSRIKVWTEAQAKVLAEIKESGLEITETMAAQMSNYTAHARGPQVNVREDLQEKISECYVKVQEHTQAAAEYDAWVQVLSANPNQSLELSQADWMYFFGKA